MKNSKFTEAYLNIIKEENEGFDPAEAEAEGAKMTEQSGEGAQVICFKTTDKNLIDAINSGFDEVVFFVKAKDEATGEDTVTEVKFGPESFEELEVKPAEEGETCPYCETNPCTCENIEQEDTSESTNAGGEGGETNNGGTVEGDDVEEDTGDALENIDPSEWLEDGVCVKCGNPECDGSCKCKKCGSQNCIGDCEDEASAVTGECGDGVGTVEGEDTDGAVSNEGPSEDN